MQCPQILTWKVICRECRDSSIKLRYRKAEERDISTDGSDISEESGDNNA